MSGRDWKRFLSDHRKQMAEFSTTRKDNLEAALVSGSRRQMGFNEIDYEKLLQSVQREKERGNARAHRIKELSNKGKKSREDAILHEHKKAWLKGQDYLSSEYRKCHLSMGSWLSGCGTGTSLNLAEVVLELLEYERQLKCTEHATLQSLYEPIRHIKATKSTSQLEKLKAQYQDQYQDHSHLLDQECTAICKDLDPILSRYDIDSLTLPLLKPNQAVPEEVWSLDCPSNSLRHSVAKEFEFLNDQFETKARELRERFSQLCEDCQWSREDRLHYSLVLIQYPPGIEGRRRLYIDRLTRELPHKTRTDIVHYEGHNRLLQHVARQMDLLCMRWVESYLQLLERTRAVFMEAILESKRKEAMKRERQKQADLCESLSRKVAQWRKQCLLLHEAEMALVVKQTAAQEAEILKDERRRQEKYRQIRHSIAEYRYKKDAERQKELLAQEKRVEEMETIMKEQAKLTKQRVSYRNQLREAKQEQQRADKERFEEEHQLKEQRLEALRQQVRVTAESDTDRLISNTIIMSDKRVRLTAALREAGLLSNHYAKTMLARVSPSHPPRPDQHSSIFQQ